jgi:hypothetical protein
LTLVDTTNSTIRRLPHKCPESVHRDWLPTKREIPPLGALVGREMPGIFSGAVVAPMGART